MDENKTKIINAIQKYIDKEIAPVMNTTPKKFMLEIVKVSLREDPIGVITLVSNFAPDKYKPILSTAKNILVSDTDIDIEMVYNLCKKAFSNVPKVTIGKMTFSVSDLEELKMYIDGE